MSHILSVEDDARAAAEIRDVLSGLGHEVDIVPTGREGLAKVMGGPYDLVLLDRKLPDFDGLTVLSTMRSMGITTPVLLLSAISVLDERIRSLKAGCDDYLIKPFVPDEMAARVAVLLRRGATRVQESPRLVLGALEMDLITRMASFHGRELKLMPTERRVLEYMMRNAGQMLTRTMIFEGVWGYRFDPGTNVIDVHVSRLRGKLVRCGSTPSIRTVRGAGYMLDA